jgi:hypothetical protein
VTSAGIPTGPGVEDWDPPASIVDRIAGIDMSVTTGVAMNLNGNLDGGSVAGEHHRIEYATGMVNGINGTRGDATTVDTANGDGTFFFAHYQNSTLGSFKGSAHHYASFMTVNENGAGGVYGEAFNHYAKVTSNRSGALTGSFEGQNVINSGKPARGTAVNGILTEGNALAAYTGAIFGASSPWVKTGARVFDAISNGAQPAGVGYMARGGMLHYFYAMMDATSRAAFSAFVSSGGVPEDNPRVQLLYDRITFGGGGGSAVDTYWQRSGAGQFTTGAGVLLAHVATRGTGGNGFVEVNEQTSDAAATSNAARLFARDSGGKTQLCVRFGTGAVQVLSTEP